MIRDKIRGTRMGLVVVDPQLKFTLDTPDWDSISKKAIEKINLYTSMFREYGNPVIFINFDGPSHMSEYAEQEGWLNGIEFSETDIVVHKKHMSCFKETDLQNVLQKEGVDCILFVGLLTEYCVASTYFSASERGYMVYLGKDALISYHPKGNEAAEVIFSMVEDSTVRTFLAGKQEPIID